MKKTYQPFILKLADEILEILKEDVKPSEFAKDTLCDLMTQKFIDGDLSNGDNFQMVFKSEDEIIGFIGQCHLYEEMSDLKEKGLVGEYEDGFFLTEQGKLYFQVMLKHQIKPE